MRKTALLLAALVVVAGCGTPSSPSKQAEQLASIAAEGALAAHDAAEGSTTDTFTRVHGNALEELASKVEKKAATPQLRTLATRIARSLDDLSSHPGDEGRAAQVQRELERAAKTAGELEQSG